MAADLRGTVSDAAQLALDIGSAAWDAASLVVDLGQEFPLVNPVLKTLMTVRAKVDTVTSNREELVALYGRCTYITACVLVKCRRNSSSQLDTRPLEERVEAVEKLVDRCGRRWTLSRVLWTDSDNLEIAGLHDRMGDLTGDMGLAGIATVEEKVDDLQGVLVSVSSTSDAAFDPLQANYCRGDRWHQICALPAILRTVMWCRASWSSKSHNHKLPHCSCHVKPVSCLLSRTAQRCRTVVGIGFPGTCVIWCGPG